MARVVVTITDELPIRLKWKKATVTITEIADAWRETGRWWADETECAFYLVDTAQGLFLLCQNPKVNEWYAKPVC